MAYKITPARTNKKKEEESYSGSSLTTPVQATSTGNRRLLPARESTVTPARRTTSTPKMSGSDWTKGLFSLVDGYSQGVRMAREQGAYDSNTWDDQYKKIKGFLDDNKGQIKDNYYNALVNKMDVSRKGATSLPAYGGTIDRSKPAFNQPASNSKEDALKYANYVTGASTPGQVKYHQNMALAKNTFDYMAGGGTMEGLSYADLKDYQQMAPKVSDYYDKLTSAWNARNKGEQSVTNLQLTADEAQRNAEAEIRKRNNYPDYWQFDNFTDEEKQEVNDARAAAENGYTVQKPKEMPAQWTMTGNINTANEMIGREMESRDFQKKYAQFTYNDDFANNSRYQRKFLDQHDTDLGGQDARKNAELLTSLHGDDSYMKKYNDIYYEAVNGNKDAMYFLRNVKNPNTGEVNYSADSFVEEYMNDYEREIFNYMFATQGADAAKEYVDGIRYDLTKRAYLAADEEFRERLKNADLVSLGLANLASVPLNLAQGAANFLGQGAEMIMGRRVNPYSYENTAGTIRDVTEQKIVTAVEEAGGGDFAKTLASMGYNAFMSGLDSSLSLALGSGVAETLGLAGGAADSVTKYISLGLMSSGAASNTLNNELMMGIPQGRAALDSMTAGLIEFATERIGMDNLFNNIINGRGGFAAYMKQVLAEGAEELVGDVTTDAINQLYDIIGNTSYSELNRQANAYWLENGMAPSQRNEAMAHVLLDRLQEYAIDTMVGSLSVITGEGSVGAIANFNNAKALTSHLNESMAPQIIEEAKTLDPNSRAYRGAMALQERMMNEFNPVTITPKEVQKIARDIVYEVQGIENDTERKQAEQDMFKAFGIDRLLHPDVQTTAEQPRTTNDPNAGEFEVNRAEDDAVKAAQDAEQKRIDTSTINSIINEATNNNTEVSPDEISRRVNAVATQDSADDLSDILTPEQVQTVEEIASRNSAAQAVQNAMDAIAEKSVPVRQEEAAEETVRETVEEEPVTEQEQPSIEVDTSGFANTLTPAARQVYEQTLAEARQNGMNAADATQAFLEVYTAGTHRVPYAPSRNNQRLSGATRAMISQTAHRESTEYTTKLEQKGFARSAAAGTKVQTSKGLVATPVLARAVQDGRISQRTADVMNKLGQMLGVRINVLSTNPKYNGEYKAQQADINLYLDAKFFNSKTTDEAVIGVLGHELSHRLEDISPEAYRQLTTMVMQTMGSSGFARMVQHNMRLAPGMTILDAQGEVVSDFVGTMLFQDSDFVDRFIGNVQVQTAEQRTALQGLRDIVHKVIDWIRGNKDAFKEPEKTITWMEKLENTLTNLIKQSAAAVGESENIVEAENIEYLPAGEHTETVQTPVEEVQYSLKYKDEVFDAVAKYNLEHGLIDEHTLAAAKETMDEVAEALNDPKVQELIPEENRLARVDRDEKGKLYTTLYGNASYGYTGENTTVCPRSLAMENLLDLVSQKLGHSLTVKEGMAVSQLAWAYTAQPTCQYCYVWADRLAQREARNTYLQMRDNVLKAVGTLGPNDKVVTQAALTTPTTKNGKNTNTVFILNDAIAKHPEFEKQLRAYDEFLAGRKNTKQQKRRFVQWLTLAKNGAAMVTQAQAATDVSMAQAVMDNPDLQEQMKDLYDYSLKASHAKLKVGYVAYNNDILKLSDKVIEMMNKNYGIRFYSYSDYHPAFILENMQMFTDAAAMGLKGLAYTKDLDFVRIFAGTGCNINISIKAIDGTTEMDAMQGADWEEAKKLRNKKGNENVGIILVATSDEQVEWGLDQEWIDVVIPYHVVFSDKVGQIYGWKNYKAFQADKKLKGWDASKDVKEITPPMHQNNRQLYFDLCDQYHLEPRFKQWRNHPGYMKLVNETRQAEGMTQPMQPVFNLDAAKDSLAKLVKDGGYDNPYATRNQETIRELAEEFAPIVENASDEKLEQIARGEIRASRKDADYLAAVNAGNMETAQRMVDEAAAAAGYTIKAYHGTANGGKFNIFDPKKLNNSKLTSHIGQGFYFTNDRNAALEYTKNYENGRLSPGTDPHLFEGYIKLENPIEVSTYSHNLTYSQIRNIVSDGNNAWFFDRGIAQELQNKEINGESYTKNQLLAMDREQKIDLYSQYLSRGGDQAALSNLVDAYTYDTQDLLLEAMKKYTGHDGIHWQMREGLDQFVVFDSSQFKESDPVTYDDAGNVIPLSERFNTESPDIRYSSKDSSGNTLTEAQAEYFKDSKVRDENGNLLVMYHGSYNDFTVFENREPIHGRNYGDGYYFTDDKNEAFDWAEGAKIYESYLNITNPYMADKNVPAPDALIARIEEQLHNDYKEGAKNPDWMFKEFVLDKFTEDQYVEDRLGRYNNAESALHYFDDSTSVLKELGYDGVISVSGNNRHANGWQEVVAFDSNQVKLTSNQNPTDSQDIRYSRRNAEATDDFRSIVERNQQREQTRMFLDASADWRQEQTRLDVHKLRGSTEAMLKTYGDKLTKDQREKLVQRVNSLAYDVLRKNGDTFEIEQKATKIAGDIVFQSARVDDKAGRAVMMNDPQTEEAIDYLTNYILANIVSTQTQQGKKLQEQIEKNAKLKDTLREVRQKRDAKIREGIESRKRQQTVRTDSALRKSILARAKRLKNMKMGQAGKALLQQLIGDMNTDVSRLTEGKIAKIDEVNAWLATQDENNINLSESTKKLLALANQKYLDDIIAKGDVEKLRQLNEALAELEHMVRNQNRLIAENDRRDLREIAYEEADIVNNSAGTKEGLFRKIDSVMVQGTLSPMRFVRRLTGYNEKSALYRLAKAIDEGTLKQQDYQMRASKLFDKWMRDRNLTRKWAGKKADIITYDVVTFDGHQKQIQMTPAMRMTLYLASQDAGWMRHMVGADGPDGHIDGAGIHMPNMKNYKKGDMEAAYSARPDDSHKFRVTKAFLNKIAADLTDEERAFADAAQKFFNGMQKEEINAVSNELVGRDLAVVDNYLPIDVDKNFTGVDYGAIQNDGTVTGIGNLKERQNSGAPVYVRDLTDILIKSINSTSAYVGLAIPIRNMNKLLGVNLGSMMDNGQYLTHETSLNEAIDKKWGQTAKDYINKMLADIQHPVRVQEDLEKAFAKLRSNYARSVLPLNLSVGLKQSASYPTAAAVVGWEPLAKALKDVSKVDLDLIAKYTPLLWYRSRGFINPDLEGIKNQNDFFSNLPRGLDWITGVDFLTTRKLWKAAEYYVRSNQPNLYHKGAGIYGQTDAYNEAVAEVYNRIIEETQPNYTPWQRPQYLRSQSGIVRTLMMFKTQPLQNFNILYDAVGNFKAKQRAMKANGSDPQVQAQFKDASRNLRRAVTSQIGQLITFAAMTMLWNMFRRKEEKYEDEEGNFSIETMLKSMGKDIGSGIFGMVPFGADAWSLISSLAFGDKYYGFESVTDSALGDLGSAFKTTWDTISKMVTSGEPFDITTYKKKIKTVGTAVAKIFGIPAENIYNLFTALYMRGRDLTENQYMADYYALAWTENPAQNKKQFVEIAWQAYNNGDMDAYEEVKDILVTDLGFSEDTINDNMKKFYASQYATVPGDTKLANGYQHLYELYKTDKEAFEAEYNKMLDIGFTEEAIKDGVETQMKAEAGVKSVSDLEERFAAPGTKTEPKKPEITKPSASRPQTPEPETEPEPEETKPKHNFVSATEGPKKQSDKKKTAPQEGTLSSSLLGGYYYNNGTLQLQVNGAWYTYNNVPEEVFQGLLDAPSAGSYFSYNIKGKY